MTTLERLNRARRRWTPRRWYDWQHAAMELLGRDGDGQEAPRGRDLYYVAINDLERIHRPLFEGQQDQLGFIKTTEYSLVRRHRDISWKVFDLQDDGHTVLTGHYPELGSDGRIRPAAISGNEIKLFWRWYWIDHRLKGQWLGLRSWIWYRALHGAVHRKIPFTCQITPPPGVGGYGHWHCDQPKRHAGPHRFRNYSWVVGENVVYDPVDARA